MFYLTDFLIPQQSRLDVSSESEGFSFIFLCLRVHIPVWSFPDKQFGGIDEQNAETALIGVVTLVGYQLIKCKSYNYNNIQLWFGYQIC